MSPISLYDALSTLKDSMDIAKTRVQLDGYISGVSVYKGKGNSGNEYCTFCITDVTGPSIHVFVPNYAYKNYSKDIFIPLSFNSSLVFTSILYLVRRAAKRTF